MDLSDTCNKIVIFSVYVIRYRYNDCHLMYTSNGYAYTMPSPASESQPETPVSPEPPAYSTTQAPTTQPPHPIALLRAVDLMDPGKIAQVFCESAYVTSC